MLEKLRDWESINAKLKNELEDASHQLIVNSSDLANSKLELQRHRNEIDVMYYRYFVVLTCLIIAYIFFNRDLT